MRLGFILSDGESRALALVSPLASATGLSSAKMDSVAILGDRDCRASFLRSNKYLNPSLKVPLLRPSRLLGRSSPPCPEAPNSILVRATESMSPRRAGYVDWVHRCACSDIEPARRIESLTPLCAGTAVDEKRCTDNASSTNASSRKASALTAHRECQR